MRKHWWIAISIGIGMSLFSAQSTDETDLNLIYQSVRVMGPQFEMGTARSSGMAGAMGALGGDASAVNLNPAGAAVFIKSDVSFTLSYSGNKDNAILGNSNTANNDRFGFNQIGGTFVIPTHDENWNSFNISLLYDRQDLTEDITFGANDKISYYDYNADGNYVENYNFEGYTQSFDGKKEKIALGLSTNYKNELYLGANLNFHSYRMYYDNTYYGYLKRNQETYSFTPWGYPYNESGNGVSFSLGAIYKPINEIRLGASFQTPIAWNEISTEYDQYYYDENSGLVDSEVGIGLWEEDRAQSAATYTLSFGTVLKKSFALNFDYIGRLNSNNKFKPNSEYIGTNNFLQNYVKNGQEFRVGAEYRFNNWSFRGGFNHQSSPMRSVSFNDGYLNGEGMDEDYSISDFIAGKRQTLALGLGYRFNNFDLNFAYQNSSEKYQTLIYGVHVDPGFYPLDVVPTLGSVENKRNNFIVGLNFHF